MTTADRIPRSLDYRPVPVARLVLLVVTALILHALVFRRWRLAGVGPDLLLTLAIVGSLQLGLAGGAALGFLSGLAADMTAVDPVGLWAFVGGLVGMIAGSLGERAFSASLRRPPYVLVAVLTFVALPVQRALAYAVVESPFPSAGRTAWLLLLVPAWGIVLTLPVHRFVRLVMGRNA